MKRRTTTTIATCLLALAASSTVAPATAQDDDILRTPTAPDMKPEVQWGAIIAASSVVGLILLVLLFPVKRGFQD